VQSRLSHLDAEDPKKPAHCALRRSKHAAEQELQNNFVMLTQEISKSVLGDLGALLSSICNDTVAAVFISWLAGFDRHLGVEKRKELQNGKDFFIS